jgi:hypothetical protein
VLAASCLDANQRFHNGSPMKMNEAAEKNVSLIDWIIDVISREMSGMERMSLSYQLTELIGGSEDEVLRAVEEKTKAKDKGKVLAIINRHKT